MFHFKNLGMAALLIAGSLALVSCGGVGIAAGAAQWGYGTALAVDSGSGDMTVEYDESNPTFESLAQLKAARTLAVYPGISSEQGRTVDIFREKTDLMVVSSAETMAWVRKQAIQEVSFYPQGERRSVLARFARENNADIVLFVESLGGTKHTGSAYTFNDAREATYQTTVLDNKGNILWFEQHTLKVHGKLTPSPAAQAAGLTGVIADRLMQLRMGK